MHWTLRESDDECGGCSRTIPAGDAFVLLTETKLVRCQRCAGAMGLTVNDTEVAEERARLDAQKARPLATWTAPVKPPKPTAPHEPARDGKLASTGKDD